MQSKTRRPRRRLDGILLLDKPLGLSSNEALQRVKRLYRAEKAGHTGSLDPLATGVLPICLGEATKLSGVLLESDKRYVARLRFGEQTRTGDAEGEVIARSDPSGLKPESVQEACAALTGVQQQVPPMYSALKHQGRPLYEIAREGGEVERTARSIEIYELKLLAFDGREADVEVHCSKGTYIRTLAEDLAARLQQCAHLRALRRTEVTPFVGSTLHTLPELEALAGQDEAPLDRLLLSPAQGLRHWPSQTVDALRAQAFAQGRAQRLPGVPREAQLAILDEAGRLLGLARSDEEGWVRPLRWLLPGGL